MPQLIVRNIEDAVVCKLRTLAATHGVSMEEEHRRLLRNVLLVERENQKSFSEMLISIPKATVSESENLFVRQCDLPRESEF